MNKLKILLLILLTVALLVACASLPTIAAALQDTATVNHSGYSDMQSLKLDFSKNRQLLPILGKLALIRDGSFYTISPNETVIRQSGIKQVVQNGLSLYYQVSLIPYNWKNYEFSAVPHLVSNPADVESYAIMWVVTIYWPDSDDHLELYVDDETGLILYLHFNTSRSLDMYSAQGYLDVLSNAYFESTGIAEILADPASFGVDFVTSDDSGMYTNGDKAYYHTIYHPDYGHMRIEFWLYQNGFYTLIREN